MNDSLADKHARLGEAYHDSTTYLHVVLHKLRAARRALQQLSDAHDRGDYDSRRIITDDGLTGAQVISNALEDTKT